MAAYARSGRERARALTRPPGAGAVRGIALGSAGVAATPGADFGQDLIHALADRF